MKIWMLLYSDIFIACWINRPTWESLRDMILEDADNVGMVIDEEEAELIAFNLLEERENHSGHILKTLEENVLFDIQLCDDV